MDCHYRKDPLDNLRKRIFVLSIGVVCARIVGNLGFISLSIAPMLEGYGILSYACLGFLG